MKCNFIPILFLFCALFITFVFTGCTVKFTPNDALQFNLSKPTDETVSLVAEFESGEEDNVAGDVTKSAGSVCAGGACIIY